MLTHGYSTQHNARLVEPLKLVRPSSSQIADAVLIFKSKESQRQVFAPQTALTSAPWDGTALAPVWHRP